MRPFVAAIPCALAICAGVESMAAAATAWHSGDTVVYDVTIELQQHTIPKAGSAGKESTKESASAGTLTFVVNGVDAGGNRSGTARLHFVGGKNGRYDQMLRTVSASVSRDGALSISDMQASELGKALALAGEAIVQARAQPMRTGRTWQSGLALAGLPEPMLVIHAIGAARQYRGYPTYPIGTSGSTTLVSSAKTGKLTLSSTVYYDLQDRMLIGESVRNFTIVLNNAGGHSESTVLVNIALRAVTRGSAGLAPYQSAPTATTAPAVYPPAPSPVPTVTPYYP